ncbi:hypothetical protein pqer_cds_791 [Pandoravirus quercus]|uniref:Uncharacterized protein n=1 Tax=Pandoravirus quercus TaxID=2107709 RepID=A0A2U7U9U7_9VIRU|nr:hypothetical protein pqer_cds_791 [Pandoravirus quercus]AVK75213.1 hypothetical protein pqer_cds_791 [Pandoravirus quercus]
MRQEIRPKRQKRARRHIFTSLPATTSTHLASLIPSCWLSSLSLVLAALMDRQLDTALTRTNDSTLKVLSLALASAARAADDQDGQDGYRQQYHGRPAATAADASAIRDRFAGFQSVYTEWRQEVQHRAAGCDPRGVRLCFAAIDALGADIHGVRTIPADVISSKAMRGVPRNRDEGPHIGRTVGFASWDLDPDDADDDDHHHHNNDANDDDGNNDGDQGERQKERDHSTNQPRGTEGQDRDDAADSLCAPALARAQANDTPTPVLRESGCQPRSPSPPYHLLLSCSRPVAPCNGDNSGGDNDSDAFRRPRVGDTATTTMTATHFVFEVRIGFCPDVWATVGPLVNAETGACVDLGCLLVARSKPSAWDYGGVPWVERRRLLDFLASGHSTWAAFAARRYDDLRRLPAALAARGWLVRDVRGERWSWNPDKGPMSGLDSRSLRLSRPTIPADVCVHFDGDCLLVSMDGYARCRALALGAPGILPRDPSDSMFYRDTPGFPLDPCRDARARGHWTVHAEADIGLQRTRLVGMGLASPCAVHGRTQGFASRQCDQQESTNPFLSSNIASRALPPVGADAMADLIDAYVTQALFGEYGPMDAVTGQRLNGGMCDHLLDAAVASGRLWSGLRFIRGLDTHAYECPIDCDLTAVDGAGDGPRMLVNWRARCKPVCAVAASSQGAARRRRSLSKHRLRVWMAIAVQTDGRGGACVALVVPAGCKALLDERVDDPTADGATWRAVAARCAKGAPDSPADLHPALVASLEVERACRRTACVVPWAYHTGADGPVDARLLTDWALDRVAHLLKAVDDAVPLARAEAINTK